MIAAIVIAIWEMLVASSSFLLIGFFIAGLIHVFLPDEFIKKHLKAPGFLSVLKSSAFGIPLPLCSCSVIPVGISLRRSGASKGATASFFVSTPEVGVDSFLLSYALLGPFMAVVRLVVSFFSALSVGLAIETFDKDQSMKIEANEVSEKHCCKVNAEKAKESNWLIRVIKFSFVEILDDIAVVLVIGFVIAGVLSAVIPENYIENLELSYFFSMLAMLLISLPVYVCATSSTPIAAALLLKGVAPGAVLVFLLAGPATNITTILVLAKELGKKAAIIYVTGIILCSLAAGALLQEFFLEQISELKRVIDFSEHSHGLLAEVSAVIVLLLVARSLFVKLRKAHLHHSRS